MTIRMIAEKCGCSTATVSKALNGAEDVSRETAERVRRVAAQLGYMPNAAARSMRTSRSYCFGVLFRDNADTGLAHEFFSGLLNGFKRQGIRHLLYLRPPGRPYHPVRRARPVPQLRRRVHRQRVL